MNQNPFEAPENQAPQNAAGAPPAPNNAPQMPAQPNMTPAQNPQNFGSAQNPQQFPSQPINSVLPPTPPNATMGAPTMPLAKKSHLGLILGIIGGVVGLAVIAIVLIILLGGSGMNVKKFRAAIDDEKAINCELSSKGSSETKILLQTTDGWDKIKLSVKGSDLDQSILAFKDDDVMYISRNGINTKVDYDANGALSSILDNFDSDDFSDKNTTFTCPAPDEIDWSVPSEDLTDSTGNSTVNSDTNTNTNSNSNTTSNVFKDTFVSSCNSGGNQAAFCECTYNYLDDRGYITQIINSGGDTSKVTAAVQTEAATACASEYNQN